MNKILLSFLLLFILTACSVNSFFLGDENLSEAVDLPDSPDQIELDDNWSRSIGDGYAEQEIKLRPFITQDSLYAASYDKTLVAYSLTDGDEIWEVDTGQPIVAGVAGNQELIFAVSINGTLLSYSRATGELMWQQNLSSEVLSLPLVVNNIVVTRAIDGEVSARDTVTGNLIWKYYLTEADLSVRGNADLLLLDRFVLATSSNGSLTLLDIETGESMISTIVSVGKGKTHVERISDLTATPSINEGMLYVSSYRNETVAIDLKSGSVVWRSEHYSTQDIFSDNINVYLIDKNSVIYALDKRTGQVNWQTDVLEGRQLSPISGNGRVIVTLDFEGNMIVLDNSTGNLLGYEGMTAGRTYIAPFFIAENKMVIYSSEGDLQVITLEHQ